MIPQPLNILIGGAPRTGKSILAASLFEMLGCPVIHGDTLVNAIKNNYPSAFGIEFATLLPEDHVGRMIPIQLFLKKVIRNMGKDIAYRAKIFESCYLHPQTVVALAREGPIIAVFLVYGNFTVQKRIKDIRTYAETNQHCWSHTYDDASLAEALKGLQHFSRFLRAECQRYGVDWVEIEDDWSTEWTRLRNDLVVNARKQLGFP